MGWGVRGQGGRGAGGTGEKLKNLNKKVKKTNLDQKKIGFIFGVMSRIM